MRQLEPTMTKADQVRALLKAGKTSREIADEVGCHDAYVRVIIQRDAGVDHAGEYRKRVFTKAMAAGPKGWSRYRYEQQFGKSGRGR